MNQDGCHFCDPDSEEFQDSLIGETHSFWIVADSHPIVRGHVLIIPKEHVSCVGAFDEDLLDEFQQGLDQCMGFVKRNYGRAAWFEHGILGQTIFHSHVHVLPFEGGIKEIVPEGNDAISFLEDAAELKWLFEAEGGYLATFLRDQLHVIDATLAKPRFFRDRFAAALGTPERGDWKTSGDAKLSAEFAEDFADAKARWAADAEIA